MRSAAVSAAAAVVVLAASAAGQEAPGAPDELPRIRITDPGRDLFRLGLPKADGDADLAKDATEIETRDLQVVGLFRLLDPASFPPALIAEGLGFSSALWGQVGAQGVAKVRVTRAGGGLALEGRLYQIGRGEAPVLTRTYRGGAAGDLRDLVHSWTNDLVEHFTGKPGIFGSRIVFAQAGRGGSREIGAVDMDGGRASILTKMGSECLLPAYSPGGREIAFTSFLRGNPDLWIVSAGGGRARRVSKQFGLNTGAAWAPDGRSLALTMSFEGNSEIYRIRPDDGSVLARLTNSGSIDSSPSFSPDGGQIAFVSNRQGTPQIWVMPSSGGGGRRVTFQGRYNQTPRFNPRSDKPLIAFTGRDERGTFDIFIHDLKSGTVERVTQNQGSNYDPSWSPDGRLVVYASSRGGLFVTNPETRHEVQIHRGTVSSPSWGPAPRRPK